MNVTPAFRLPVRRDGILKTALLLASLLLFRGTSEATSWGGTGAFSYNPDFVGVGVSAPYIIPPATAPVHKFEVGGGAYMSWARFNNSSDPALLWEVGSDNTANGFYVYKVGSGYKMVVNASGYLGLGTLAPKAGLHINNVGSPITGTAGDKGYAILGLSGGKQMQIDDDEIQAMNNNTPSALNLNWGGGNTLINVSNGSVGIGTSTPASGMKLDVRGGGAFKP
jgi:hypothetical protein